MSEQLLLVGGEWTHAEDQRTFEKVSPVDGGSVASVAAASVADAQRAASSAADALEEWTGVGPGGRRQLLTKAADLLASRAGELVALMAEEMGATSAWGGFNVHVAQGMLREAAAHAYSAVGEVIPSDVPGLLALAVREPVGVVLGIAPWNAPLILGVRSIALPLAFGNTVVLKASEQAPRTQAEIVRALHDAGLPPGAANLVTNAPADAEAVVDALIAHPAVRRINFTGSTRVGRVIAEKSGRHLKRALLELGGKAPLVVLADADLDEAAAAANFGSFMNAGQICMSTERIIVDRSVAAAFADRLVERANGLVTGDPRDPSTHLGPLIDQRSRDRVAALVDDAVAKGAGLLCGGESDGLLFPATVLLGVTPEMRVYGEESFGPLASIVVVDGVEEAVRTANDTEYGLSGAVFSADVAAAIDVAKRIRSGICHINSSTVHDEPQMPFGGVKASGYGRFGSRAAVDEFTDLRWLTIQSGHRHYPI
ncbi:MAG TPA: aldehyde dehydrogenase [Baekduia sp.]|nr:aldehyde dehydrogenase [Baekduia sp.]